MIYMKEIRENPRHVLNMLRGFIFVNRLLFGIINFTVDLYNKYVEFLLILLLLKFLTNVKYRDKI